MVPSQTGQEHSSQLLKGVLDMCLLALVAEQPTYGYEMARKLEERGLHLASEGSIYPLLSRLRRDGLVTSTWRESETGPPRRYYRLTSDGRRALDLFNLEWHNFRTAVDAVLLGRQAEGGRDG